MIHVTALFEGSFSFSPAIIHVLVIQCALTPQFFVALAFEKRAFFGTIKLKMVREVFV